MLFMIDEFMLLFLFLAPFVGAVFMLATSSRDEQSAFRSALICSLLPFIVSSYLLFSGGDSTFNYEWITLPSIGDVYFSLVATGLSLWMCWLTALLCFLSFIFARSTINFSFREFAIGMLALEGTILGVFLSGHNVIQFLFFFEAMILPAAVLISMHGGLKRRKAAFVFALYTLLGSVPLIFAVLYLWAKGAYSWSSMGTVISQLPPSVQISLFISFFIAFAVKTPLFPLHSWQPLSYSEAPYPLTAILSGAMAKVGVFGFVACVIPAFSKSVLLEGNVLLAIIFLCLFSMLYGAILAYKQIDAKKLLAFSSLSHLSLAVAGVFCLSEVADAGVIVLLVGHGLSTGALFFLMGIVHRLVGSSNLKSLGAIASTNPILAFFFGFVAIATIAVPGTIGFIGEFLVLRSLFAVMPIFAVLGGICIVLSAAYTLKLVRNVLFGEGQKDKNTERISFSPFEGLAIVSLTVSIMFFGLYPAPIIKSLNPWRYEKQLTTEEIDNIGWSECEENAISIECMEEGVEDDN